MLQTAQECQEEPPLLCQLLSEDSNCITTSQVRQNDLAQEVVLWSMTCTKLSPYNAANKLVSRTNSWSQLLGESGAEKAAV